MLEAIAATPPAVALRTTPWLYGLVSGLHFLGLGALFGAILTLDLRLLCLQRAGGWRRTVAPARPIAAAGLAAALVTGFLLFAVRPSHYLESAPFIAKIALIVIGMLNAAAFHLRLARRSTERPGTALRASAIVSVLTWTAAIFAGRFIAFT